jgi:hypothetical protein
MRRVKDFLWRACGHSRTLLVAYGLIVLAALEEARLVDWSPLVGAERSGRVVAVLSVVIVIMRLITTSAVRFK